MKYLLVSILVLFPSTPSVAASKYRDGRPETTLRMDAKDQGIVLRYGDGPERCEMLGARDVWVFQDGDTYYMHYDAAGPNDWLCSLAISQDLLRRPRGRKHQSHATTRWPGVVGLAALTA